jgi:hypothetical protein
MIASQNPLRTPPLPDLEKFRTNLAQAMAAKHMTGSDVARAVWGTKIDKHGKTVARNRDRMTHYLAGQGYPRPETVAKLAEVLGIDPRDLEREATNTTVTELRTRANSVSLSPEAGAMRSGSFEFKVRAFGRVHITFDKDVDMRFAIELFDFIRARDPDFNHTTAPPSATDALPEAEGQD